MAVGYVDSAHDHPFAMRWDGGTWALVPTPVLKGPDSHLSGVSCVSATSCVAVGYTGDIRDLDNTALYALTESWDGRTWRVVPGPQRFGLHARNFLNDVSCRSETDCVAVGQSMGQGLAESWDGTAWRITEIIQLTGNQDGQYLWGVSCTAGVCMAVGSYGVVTDIRSRTLVQTWNGKTWTTVPSPTPATDRGAELLSVSCAGPAWCMAAGTALRSSSASGLWERWNGKSWAVGAAPHVGFGSSRLAAVSCMSTTACTAVGVYYQNLTESLIDSWNGKGWTQQQAPAVSSLSSNLAGVSCSATKACTAVGSYQDPVTNVAHTLVNSIGPPSGSTTALAVSTNPSLVGSTVTLSASVAAVAPATGVPSGRVQFLDGGAIVAACGGSAGLALDAGGHAHCSVAFATAGLHSLVARYLGDRSFIGSSSPPTAQAVDAAAVITSSSTVSFAIGLDETFTVVASGFPAPSLTAVGTLPAGVTFTDNGDGTATLTGTATAFASYPLTVTAHNGVGADAVQNLTLNVTPPSGYTSLASCRLVDTRTGRGSCASAPTVPAGPLGAGHVFPIQVGGVGGVPSDATAVVFNLTAVGATTPTHLSVYPHGGPVPGTASLNVGSADPVANLVTVPLGADGKVDVANYTGYVNVVADLAGFYAPSAGAGFTTESPCRLFDTRAGSHTSCESAPAIVEHSIGPGGSLRVHVVGTAGIPSDATSVVLNLTATKPTLPTYLTVHAGTTSRPATSNLNVAAGATIANLVVVPLGTDGSISVDNQSGSVDVIADLEGYYEAGTGAAFAAIGPCRVADTRGAAGDCPGATAVPAVPLGPAGTLSLTLGGVKGLPPSLTAVVARITAVGATRPTYLRCYATGAALPLTSTVNVPGSAPVGNLAFVPTGAGAAVNVSNYAGDVNVVADLSGFFYLP